MRNLVLIGFMGTGKSTLGRICAERMKFTFCDTDALIVERAGRSIPEIFACEGEEGFRRRERAVVRELAERSGQVIATGGGTILDPDNSSALRKTGVIIALQASPETILSRVGETASRPLLASSPDPKARILELLARRREAYALRQHCSLDTDDREPEYLADHVIELYMKQCNP